MSARQMKEKNNKIGCVGKICILVFLSSIYLVTPMQVRLLFLARGKTIQDVKNDFHHYSICELTSDKELLDVNDLEKIYGKILVIANDKKIQRILRISKKTTSFLQRPEQCYIFFDKSGKVVGHHYELED